MRKGVFITFEGGEGAGKTTLIEKVAKTLHEKDYRVISTRAPGGTEIGREIRNLLLHLKEHPLFPRTELFLFLADRSQHVDEMILPALEEGKVVLCDRFNDSTLAYQGAARGFEISFLEQLCAFASQKLTPHLTLYLDIDPQLGLERVQKAGLSKDRIESETLLFHQKIRDFFHHIAKKEPKRVRMVDASLSPDHVFNQAMKWIYAIL